MKKVIIFSDLDGTLLDHQTYSFAPAEPALKMIAARTIPLILNSSKTMAEIAELRRDLDNRHPYVVENGGAVVVPGGYFSQYPEQHIEYFGPERNRLLAVLDQLRMANGFRFQGFADISVAELAQWTGLPPDRAAQAKQRVCSEPLRWEDSDSRLEAFRQQLAEAGLSLTAGGRFLHVMGITDKARGVRWLLEKYRAEHPDWEIISIALGDSANDREMLEAVEIPVVIENANGESLSLPPSDTLIYAGLPGPTGWCAAIQRIFKEFF